MSTSRQHAGPPTSDTPSVPETTLAERGRTLVHLGRIGMLSTHSRKQPGFPFGSIMPYAADPLGRPLFLISSMAMHTQNLKADPRASLLIAEETAGDPLGAPRITLVGEAHPLPAEQTGPVRELYLARHENARHWVDFDDFAFWRLQVLNVYFVGGFGVMGWVDSSDYAVSESDPLAESACGIIQHMNADHADALVLLAHAAGHADVTGARMTEVDRLGFHLRLESPERVYGGRLAFPREVRNPGETRTVLVEMVRAARNQR